MTHVGIISDTHGLLRLSARYALRGVDRIMHAGDIDTPGVLASLQAIAPVVAVRGNMDGGIWAESLRREETEIVEGVQIFICHDPFSVASKPETAGHRVVINGHTHKPLCEERNGVLHLNPGSAGPQRNVKPPSLAIMAINGGEINVEIVTLR